MAVVVVKDVLLFVCLAMNLELANMVRLLYMTLCVISHACTISQGISYAFASGQAVIV